MKRKLVFENNDQGRRRFELIWDGLRIGTVQAEAKSRTREIVRQEVTLRRALKGISHEVPPDDKNEDIDRRALNGGGTVELEQPLIKLLSDRGWTVQWRPHVEEEAVDALDFVDAAPEVTEEAKA